MTWSGPWLAGRYAARRCSLRLLVAALVVLATSCGGGDAEELTQQVTPAATAVPATATVVPDPTATAAATTAPTSEPTPTASPTATPTVASRADVLAAASVVDIDCPAEVAANGVACQRATLPEDDEDPGNGRRVELLLATVDTGDPLDIGPVVYLQGGPGGGGAEFAKFFVNQSLHLIFVDQRGTGASRPALDCPEIDDDYETTMALGRSEAASSQYLVAEQACADRLREEGVDASQFTTEQNADDIALLREVLDIEEWTVWGSSYGTRLALTVLRDHPEGIRAAVLDSVLPHQVDFFAGIPTTARRSLDAVIDGCVADASCVERYGDLDERIDATAEQLDVEPVVVDASRPVSRSAMPVLVDGGTFLSLLFDQLYVKSSIAELPSLIDRASRGELDDLVQRVVDRNDPEVNAFSEGLYFTTWCSDEVPFNDRDADEAVLAGETAAFRSAHEHDMAEHCDVWDVDAADPVEDEAVESEVPTLLFAGGFDPITPPDYAELAASTLTNSKVVVMPNHGHGMFTPCPTGLMVVFLQDPERVADLDTTCAETVPAITWN